MLLRAFAKINLDLRVGAKRPDGYHEIRTIFQTIDWCDEIRIERSDRFEFKASGAPEDGSNLVVRAVRSFEAATGVAADVKINLIKRIPIGAGLGGGSADAAVTLIGLQRLFDAPLVNLDLWRSLRSLGSDVPFFGLGGCAVGLGRGDEVYPLQDIPAHWITVVKPEIGITTAEAYSWLTDSVKSNNIEGFCAQFLSSSGRAEWANDFEEPVFMRLPELSDIRDKLLQAGAFHAALSGSGSVVFGRFESEHAAEAAASRLARRHFVKVTTPLSRSEYVSRLIAE